ncbi:hypothetical protein PENTCL1PPCAC_20675, partial [Pristionchus entomophagus]
AERSLAFPAANNAHLPFLFTHLINYTDSNYKCCTRNWNYRNHSGSRDGTLRPLRLYSVSRIGILSN